MKEPTKSGKSNRQEKSKESLLVDPREVKKVLMALRECLNAFPTNMLLHASSSFVISLPTSMTYLLKEFNDTPLQLPPLRGIEHHINLSLGATLPNGAAYRTNYKEGKEISKWERWVRESMSPRAMPVILVPKKYGI
ncbi:hypothetical protein CR513_35698, partial [Mucuna pruriens]